MTALILATLALILVVVALARTIVHDPPRVVPHSHHHDDRFGPPAGLVH